jgi:head-tail adaptor
MALIDRPGDQTVTVYPEVSWTDTDGNTVLRASSVGTVVHGASVQPRQHSEEETGGASLTESTYRLRLPKSFTITLGSASRVVWNGRTFAVHGEPVVSTGSIRTRRVEYTIKES